MKVSSTSALSLPVSIHWATNFPRDRLVMAFIDQIDSGIVTSATSASFHDTTNIITSVPTSVSVEVSIWLSVCCMPWARLSMSLVTRLSRSPRAWPSTYLSGRWLSLASTASRRRYIVRCTIPVSTQACR